MTSKTGEKSMLKLADDDTFKVSLNEEDQELTGDDTVDESLTEIQNTMLALNPQLSFPSDRDSLELAAELEKEHLRRTADRHSQVEPGRTTRRRVRRTVVSTWARLRRRRNGVEDILLIAVPAAILGLLLTDSVTAVPAAAASASAAAVLFVRLLKGRIEERVEKGDRARLSSELDLARCSRVRRNLTKKAGQRRLQVLDEARRQGAELPGGGPDEALVSVVLAQKSIEQFMKTSSSDKRERDAAALVAACDLRLHRARSGREPIRQGVAKAVGALTLALAILPISWLPVAYGGPDLRWATLVTAMAVTGLLGAMLVGFGVHLRRGDHGRGGELSNAVMGRVGKMRRTTSA